MSLAVYGYLLFVLKKKSVKFYTGVQDAAGKQQGLVSNKQIKIKKKIH